VLRRLLLVDRSGHRRGGPDGEDVFSVVVSEFKKIDRAGKERGDKKGNDCRASQARVSAGMSTPHFSNISIRESSLWVRSIPFLR
jgi:hypothetical protein